MNHRSHLMIRSKQQLKNQLLMGFRKKNKREEIDLQKCQQPKNIYYTPQNNFQSNPNSSCLLQNKSILDQFSKCPIREDECLYTGQKFLNKFMFTKNRSVIPFNFPQSSVSVQTQNHLDGQITQAYNLMTKTKNCNTEPNTEKSRTPTKVTNFDPKLDKSIIDISANLNHYNYSKSPKNNEVSNKILTDSILDSSQKENKENNQDNSAQQLLKQLNKGGRKTFQEGLEGLKLIKVESQIENKQRKQPIVKTIQLSRTKSTKQSQKLPTSQLTKQNKDQFSYAKDKEKEEDEKLEKLVQRKSLIKQMINKKQQQEKLYENQSQQLQNTQQLNTWSKWSKLPKKSYSGSQGRSSEQIKRNSDAMPKNITEIDPLDLLPPYETSSSGLSGLQAVIQQQNESQMEESVKPKVAKQQNNKKVISQQKKLNENNLMNNNPVKAQNIIQKKEQSHKSEQSSQSKSLKSISLGDLSLEDMSEIQNISGNKKLPDSFKKDMIPKDLSSELADYHDSQSEQERKEIKNSNTSAKQKQKQKQKIDMKKYIVNDISNDINNLKKRISKDADISINIEIDKPKQKKASSNGSEGPDKKMTSMLDFFDQVHDKLDFGQISKDIIDLRDKIANQSQ